MEPPPVFELPEADRSFDTIIEAGHTERQYWRDLWHYRELLYFLSWRDILVRYKQTALGVLWAVLRPLITIAIFTAIFSRVAGMNSEGLPYPVLVFAAMLPWQIFASAMAEAGTSLVSNANLITKVYFPRMLVPVSAVTVTTVDFAINALLFLGMLAWYHVNPGWTVLLAPFFILLVLVAAVGTGLWLAALNVTYRDFRYVVPFLVQAGLYVSPVGFSSIVIPPAWRPVYLLNPLVGAIDGFRWACSGGRTHFDAASLTASVVISTLLLWSGIRFFRGTERSFADTI